MAKEYDIYIDVDKKDIHLITYLLEGADHIMNVRNRQENGFFKIIIPEYFLEESLSLINSLNNQGINLEVKFVEPHNGVV